MANAHDALVSLRASLASIKLQVDGAIVECDAALGYTPTVAELQSLLNQLTTVAPDVIKAVTPAASP